MEDLDDIGHSGPIRTIVSNNLNYYEFAFEDEEGEEQFYYVEINLYRAFLAYLDNNPGTIPAGAAGVRVHGCVFPIFRKCGIYYVRNILEDNLYFTGIVAAGIDHLFHGVRRIAANQP